MSWPDPKIKDPFMAGWEAHSRLTDSDWGPRPPETAEAARAEWEYTCDAGHIERDWWCLPCRSMHRRRYTSGPHKGKFITKNRFRDQEVMIDRILHFVSRDGVCALCGKDHSRSSHKAKPAYTYTVPPTKESK
jgi:hypothetical protein